MLCNILIGLRYLLQYIRKIKLIRIDTSHTNEVCHSMNSV